MVILSLIFVSIALMAFTVFVFRRDKWTLRIFLKLLMVLGLVICFFALIYLALTDIYNINSFAEAVIISYENMLQIDIAEELKTKNTLGILIILLQKAYSLLIIIFALSNIKEQVQGLYKKK